MLDFLVALAEEAGITVRVIPGETGAVSSGGCRMRGEPWLLLAAGDSLEDRITAAAEAVRQFAPQLLEERFVPPAVRTRLERSLG